MESGSTANPIKDLRKALEKETRKRQALEHQLSEALTLLQNTMKDREKFQLGNTDLMLLAVCDDSFDWRDADIQPQD